MIAIAILFVVGLLLTTVTKDCRQKGVLLQCVFRSNFALIGVPLAQLMAGEKGVRSAAILSAFTIPVFNILSVVALSIYTGSQTVSTGAKIRKILRDILHNPLIIGVLAGILVVCLKPLLNYLPAGAVAFAGKFTFVETALEYLAKSSTPLALLVLGGQFESHQRPAPSDCSGRHGKAALCSGSGRGRRCDIAAVRSVFL
jgi:predicted permease